MSNKFEDLLDRMLARKRRELSDMDTPAEFASSILWVGDNNALSACAQWEQQLARFQRTTDAQNKPALNDFAAPELVMEMIRRGFAVMKLPENGEPPEALQP